ncbi:MAG: ATP-binding protein [Nodosilinea sp.]
MPSEPTGDLPPLSSSVVRACRRFSWQAGIVVLVLGVLVLLGWALDIDILKSVIPGRITQKPNTALGLSMSGLGLLLWHWRQSSQRLGRYHRWYKLGLMVVLYLVVALGVVTLIEYSLGVDLGINRLVWVEPSPDVVDAIVGGRPAPNTAISFVLLGWALLLLVQQRYWVAQGVSLGVFFIALLALNGHLYAVTDFYQVGSPTGMAIHTAVSFLLLSLGVMAARADQGWMRDLSSSYDGGIMMRRVLPIMIGVPPLLGFVILYGYERLTAYPAGAIALRSVLSIMLFSAIIWWNGRALNRLDGRRQALQAQFTQTLEDQVDARTAELRAANQALQQENARRREAEASLQQSESRTRRAIDLAPIPVVMHAEDGEILAISQTLTDITGYTAADIPTIADWTERAYGDRQTDILTVIDRLYQIDNRVNDGEFAVGTKQGETRIWDFSSAPLGTMADGRRLVISMASDITRRKQAETTLAQRAAQQAEIALIGQQALALTSQNLDDFFNSAVARVAQVLKVEYCKVLERLPGDRGMLLRAGVGWQDGLVGQAIVPTGPDSQAGYTLLNQEPTVVEDLRHDRRFSGPELLTRHGVVSGISTVIGDVEQNPFGVIGVHTRSHRSFTQNDVNFLQSIANVLAASVAKYSSQQKIQQINAGLELRIEERTQQLTDANQELEAFAYSVSHDLRAPLRAIEGLTRILQEDYHHCLSDTGQEYTQLIIESASRMDQLIQDLLAYSRLGRRDIVLVPTSLKAVVDDALRDLAPAFAEMTDLPPDIRVDPLPEVMAQRGVLRQVLINLLTNAAKFVPTGTQAKIQVWAEDRSPWVRLWVVDNGIGISERHQDRIFRPFERLHGVEAYPGTGIGLAIVQRGIERMNGQVGLESTPGSGSRFWLELSRP